jgi:NAD-dependent DNA ligase
LTKLVVVVGAFLSVTPRVTPHGLNVLCSGYLHRPDKQINVHRDLNFVSLGVGFFSSDLAVTHKAEAVDEMQSIALKTQIVQVCLPKEIEQNIIWG